VRWNVGAPIAVSFHDSRRQRGHPLHTSAASPPLPLFPFNRPPPIPSVAVQASARGSRQVYIAGRTNARHGSGHPSDMATGNRPFNHNLAVLPQQTPAQRHSSMALVAHNGRVDRIIAFLIWSGANESNSMELPRDLPISPSALPHCPCPLGTIN
jgi:hypothetical protein